MERFGRNPAGKVVEPGEHPAVTPVFFDCLMAGGVSLIDQPIEVRLAALDRVIEPPNRVRRLRTADPDAALTFLTEILDRGHEGVVAKDPESTYGAGSRGAHWFKIKPAHTLDVVVLGAEWGNGRRQGLLSNLHLGVRDEATDGYVMLGKTFKGMTDEMLAWQTERFLELETHRDQTTVYVRAELVVEVAFDELFSSRRYDSKLAFRFARVLRYRTDKRAEEADTLSTARAIKDGRLKARVGAARR
jgi:DNA ligase-1